MVAHAHVDPANPRRATTRLAGASIGLVERLQQGVGRLATDRHHTAARSSGRCRSNFEPGGFEAAVEKCKEYIRAGDIFQVVLSQRLETETHGPAVRYLPHAAGSESEPVHVLS